jgi:hypothetical protein
MTLPVANRMVNDLPATGGEVSRLFTGDSLTWTSGSFNNNETVKI